MDLVIYEKDGRRWSNFTKNLEDEISFYNEDFEEITLKKEDIIETFNCSDYKSFFKLKDILKKYKLQFFVMETIAKDKKTISFFAVLLNNIILGVNLKEFDKGKKRLKAKIKRKSIEIKTEKDFDRAENIFNFKSLELRKDLFNA